MQKHLVRQITGLLVLFLAPVFYFSQVDRGGLSEPLRNISGKVIPRARVTALQTATGLVREAVSSTSGIDYIPELSVGLYRVSCTVTGIRQVVFENIAQTIGHTSKLNFTLTVGSVTEQVNVKGRTSQLDETSDVQGGRTESEQVRDLPLNGVEVRRIQLDQGNTANGTIVYSSLNLPSSSFLVNAVSSAIFNQQLPINGLLKTAVYTYAQDEWKPRPNLTLNLGVRYSFYNILHEAHGKANPFDFATCGAAAFCGVNLINPATGAPPIPHSAK